MSPVLPRDLVDRIKDQTDIVAVVREYVPLRPAGSSFKGLCPFHQEKTPSFHVNPQRQIFKCFGCGEGGDVITFLMKLQGLSFPEALEVLARPLDLDLSRYLVDEDESGEGERQAYHRATEAAAAAWGEAFWGREGEEARRYLRDRGFGEEVLRRYEVGYAPQGTAWLVRRLEKAGVSADLARRCGLLRSRDGGEPFAYFRRRIIFPIRNIAQRIAGFGGRILGEGEPKYLNSAETPWFNKRKLLYGYARSRIPVARRRTAILVEGYLDLLALVQAGFGHAVATCGTALTPEQVTALRHGCRTLLVLYDGDRAGVKAAVRAAGVALAGGLEPRIALLPADEDPASFLQAHAPEELAGLLERAEGYLPLLARLAAESGAGRVARERAVRRALADIANVTDPVRRALLLDEAAEVFAVARPVLEEQLALSARRGRRGDPAPEPTEPAVEPAGPSPVVRQLLAHALADDAGAAAVTALEEAHGESLGDPLADAVLADLATWRREAPGTPPARWLQAGWHEREPAYRRLVAELLDWPDAEAGPHARVVRDCWERWRQKRALAARGESLRNWSRDKGVHGDHG